MTPFRPRPLALAAALAGSIAAQPGPLLEVGGEAPPLRDLVWIKGEPVAIEEGKVVVVVFWAMSCSVCRASVPTLTKVQRHGADSVRVVGIASARFDRNRERVADFVAEWGPRIGYSVAWDGKQAAAADWLDASRQRGLPVTFVVDRKQRVAWIGTPLEGLAEALARIESPDFDIVAAAQVSRLQKELAKATVRNDRATILDVTARWIETDPSRATPWISRFRALADSVDDADAALACTRDALRALADTPAELARFANEGLFAATDAAACPMLGLQTIRKSVAERCDEPQLAMAHFSALAVTKRDREAEKAADRAIELARDDAATLAALANCFVDPRYGKRFARQSLAALRRAIEVEPKDPAFDRAVFDVHASVLKDDAAATEVGRKLVRKAQRDAVLLNEFAWSLLESPSYRGRFDALALEASETVAARPDGSHWMCVDTLARAKFVNGFIDEAVELQRRAVKDCDLLRYVGDLQNRLKLYEKAAAEKRK